MSYPRALPDRSGFIVDIRDHDIFLIRANDRAHDVCVLRQIHMIWIRSKHVVLICFQGLKSYRYREGGAWLNGNCGG